MSQSTKIIEDKITLRGKEGLPIWLSIWRPEVDRPLPVIAFLPGTKGFTRWGGFPYICERLATAGNVVIGVDFSCSGVVDFGNDITRIDLVEEDSPFREVGEVRTVLDELDKPAWKSNIDPDNVILFGHSRGAAVAMLVTESDKRVSRLILWSPISHFDRYTPEQLQKWKDTGRHNAPNARTGQDYFLGRKFLDEIQSMSRHRLAEAIHAFAKPALIVYGSDDKALPRDEPEELYQAAGEHNGRYHIIPGGDHNFGAKHPFAGTTPQLEEALSKTIEWLG